MKKANLFFIMSFVFVLGLMPASQAEAFGPRPPAPPPEEQPSPTPPAPAPEPEPAPPPQPSPDPDPKPPEPEARISHFSVVDKKTLKAIEGFEVLDSSSRIKLDNYPGKQLSIVAVPEGTFGSVGTSFDGRRNDPQNNAPYWVLPADTHLAAEVTQARSIRFWAETFRLPHGFGERGEGLGLEIWVYPVTQPQPEPTPPTPAPKPPEEPAPTPPAPKPPEEPAPAPPAPKPPEQGPPTTPPSSPPGMKVPSMDEFYKLSKFNGTKNVSSTIVINKSGVYDFKNVLHIWKGRNWDCNAERENGPQILRVEASNVTVKNFSYVGDGKTHGSNGLGDPVHIATCGSGQGNRCPQPGPSNVVLDGIYGHACEDLLTIGTPRTRNITVQNSTFIPTPNKNRWDKIIQINFGEDLKFYNNLFWGSARCIRFKPNTHGVVEGNEFRNCKDSVLMSSRDKDIHPMTNGPSSVLLRSNNFNGSRVRCKDGKGSRTVGSTGLQKCD